MFSQLTALARSATDFSLDNLQTGEEDEKHVSTTTKSDVPLTPDHTTTNKTSQDQHSVSLSVSSFTNLFDASSSSTTADEVTSSSSISSSFSSLFGSKSTSSVDVSTTSSNSSSIASPFKIFEYSFSSNSSGDNFEDGSTVISSSKLESNSLADEQNEVIGSSSTFSLSKDNQHVESNVAEQNSTISDLNSKSSPDKNSTPSKKGSGREAAKLLEKQLRQTIEDLQTAISQKDQALHETEDELDKIKASYKQEQNEYARLKSKFSDLTATVADIEESKMEVMNRNEKLEKENTLLQQTVKKFKDQEKQQQQQQQQQQRQKHNQEKTEGSTILSTQQQDQQQLESVELENKKLQSDIHQLEESLSALQQAYDTNKHDASNIEKTLKAKLTASDKTIKSLNDDLALLHQQITSQRNAFDEQQNAHKITLRETQEHLRIEVERVEQEKNKIEINLTQLFESQMKEANQTLSITLQKLQQTTEESSCSLMEKESQLASLAEQLSASNIKYTELKEKFSLFTEKTKVQVKKFIESQKESEEEKKIVIGALEAKDSEITSLRLKLETVDNSLSDRKARSSELAERYSELQRDMQRKLEEISSLRAHGDELQRRMTDYEQQVSKLTARIAESDERLAELKDQSSIELAVERSNSSLAIEKEIVLREQERKTSSTRLFETQELLQRVTDECDGLRAQVEDLRERLEKGADTKKTLEEYKLRAQKAIKQANSSSATLSSKLLEAEEKIRDLEIQLSTAEIDSLSLRSAASELESQMKSELQQRQSLETKTFDLQTEILALHKKLSNLEEELEQQKQSVSFYQQREEATNQLAASVKHKQRAQLSSLLDAHSEAEVKDEIAINKPTTLKSSDNKTAVVVPVRQKTTNKNDNNSQSISSSVDYYFVNESEGTLIRDDRSVEYVELDANAHSDVENSGNLSENSSVVVQWQNILSLPKSDSNSPNSESVETCISPMSQTTSGVETGEFAHNQRGLVAVSSLTSVNSSSSNSLAGEEEGNKTEGGGDYFLVNQLKRELHRLRQEISNYHIEADDLRRTVATAKNDRAQAVQDYNDLKAFHDRAKKLLNSPDSAINIEYLKKCVYRLMVTKEISERSRLYPVISMLLKFTPVESRNVTEAIEEEIAASTSSMISLVAANSTWLSAGSALGGLTSSLFGGGAPLNGTVTSEGEVMLGSDETVNNNLHVDTTTSNTNSSSWW